MAAAAMDYSVGAVVGVLPAGLLVMRGADPQWTIPAGHPFVLLLPNAAYVAPAGAVAGQALPLSTMCDALGGSLALPPNAAGFAGAAPIPLSSIPPNRMELVLRREHWLTASLKLRSYDGVGDLSSALHAFVRGLAVAGPLHADYQLQAAELVACEAAGGALMHQAAMTDLPYEALAQPQLQWLMPDLSMVLWFGFGHIVSPPLEI